MSKETLDILMALKEDYIRSNAGAFEDMGVDYEELIIADDWSEEDAKTA